MNNNYNNLVNLLKIFKNRPYHLAKYLIENDALTDKFYNKIDNNPKLKDAITTHIDFTNISEMNEYYDSFIEKIGKNQSEEELIIELNNRLNDCLKYENYEEAIMIRDYMFLHNIKRI